LKNPWSSRTLAIGYTLFIFCLTFTLAPVVSHLREIGVYPKILLPLWGIAIAGVSFWIWAHHRSLSPKRILLLGLILAGYYFYYHSLKFSIEKVHIITYSLLAILYRCSFFEHQSKLRSYLVAGFFCALVGTTDEVLQLFIPLRVFQFSDVCLNAVSGILGLSLYAAVNEKISSASG